MIILDVNKLSKNFGFGQLFENVSFSLNEGESISIVGPNGCGKSTLLKIIAGIEKADSGVVSIKKDITVGYLDQTSADNKDDRLVRDVLSSVFDYLLNMKEKIKYYEERISKEDINEELIGKYCKLIEEFSIFGGFDIDVQVNSVSTGLGITEEMLNREYSGLSGGEKTLVQLARVLLKKPSLLLLDEPTNHLDIKRIEWLEDYIKSFKGATVIISHDRYFLDKMSNKILDLTNLESKLYFTNYSGYLKEREDDFEKQMASYKDQQIVIKRLKEQIKYFAERGMATNSTTMCNRAHALQTQLDRVLKNKINRPQEDKKYDIEFKEEKKSSKRVFEVNNLTVKVPNGKTIIRNVNLCIMSRERIALIGNNGSGKSTFIKSLLGFSSSLEITGEIYVGNSIKIGYLSQIIILPTASSTTILKNFTFTQSANGSGLQTYKVIDNVSNLSRISGATYDAI